MTWHLLTLSNVHNEVLCGADRKSKLNRTRASWTLAKHRRNADLICQECAKHVTPELMNSDDKMSPAKAAPPPRKRNMAAVRKVLKATSNRESGANYD